MSLDWLERQLLEVEAVRAVYDAPPESRIALSEAEETVLSIARGVLDAGGSADSGGLDGLEEISFTVALAVNVKGSGTLLHVTLPHGYPSTTGQGPRIRVMCAGATRDDNSRLQRVALASLEATAGDESVIAAVDAVAVAAAEIASSAVAASASATPAPGDGAAAHAGNALCRALIWFHHIKSLQKRKDILAWAGELGLGGFSKPGFPGIIVIEGAADDVQEYLQRIRALRWQAMSVRHQDTVQLLEGVSVDSARALPGEFRELAETGMSELGAACRAGGLEELFLTAMKL